MGSGLVNKPAVKNPLPTTALATPAPAKAPITNVMGSGLPIQSSTVGNIKPATYGSTAPAPVVAPAKTTGLVSTPSSAGQTALSKAGITNTSGLNLSAINNIASQQTAPAPVKTAPVATPAPATGIKGLVPPPDNSYSGLIGQLAGFGSTPSTAYTQAQQDYNDALKYQEKLKEANSQMHADIHSDPVSARVMQGRDAAVQQANTEKLGAAQSQVQQAQQGIGYAQTQQGMQQSALNSAAGLSAPVQVAPGNTLTSPTTGSTVAGGLGGYVNYQTAQQVMSLAGQYPDAGFVYNQNLSPQENLQQFQQSALKNSPTYQKSTYGAPGATSYMGGQQMGAAGALTGQVSQIQALGSGAESNFALLMDIATKGGINDANVPVLNQLSNNVKLGLTSNDAVAAFQANLESLRAQYSQILGGGTATDSTRVMASKEIPDNISLSALKAVQQSLGSEINNKVSGYNTTISQYSNGGSNGAASTQGGLVKTAVGTINTNW